MITGTSGPETKMGIYIAREGISVEGPLPTQGSHTGESGTLGISVAGSYLLCIFPCAPSHITREPVRKAFTSR